MTSDSPQPNAAPLRGLPSLTLRSFNKRVCSSLSLTQTITASHTRKSLSEMPAVALEKFLNMNIYLSIQVNKREIDGQ